MAVLQNMTMMINQAREVKDRKGWVICMAVLAITVVRSGITYSFGVFVVELEAIYHTPLAEQNWIGTLSFTFSLVLAPFSVAFIRALKYRGYKWGGIIGTVILTVSCLLSSFVHTLEWMFLTHSLLYGLGSSLVYMASSLVIGEYFDNNHKYHVLATSILLCGYPVGSLLFNPLNAYLVTYFGWRTAFRCASGMIAVTGTICCWTFDSKADLSYDMQRLDDDSESGPGTPTPLSRQQSVTSQHPAEVPHIGQDDDSIMAKARRKCCTVSELKARPEIMLWYVGNCFSYLGFYMPFINLAYYMELKGIPTSKSSWAITLLSFAECVTYIVSSFLGDYFKGRLINFNIVAAGALSFICFIWPAMDVSYGLICLISVAMGGFLGLTIVYTYAASGEVTGLPIDIAWSFTNMWSGLGILIGPFFSGFIYDFRKSYDDVFYVVGVLYLIDVAVFAAVPLVGYYRRLHPKLDYNEIQGVVGQHTETFRITKRSLSKSSLPDTDPMNVTSQQAAYGTTQTTPAPPRPPPPRPGQPTLPQNGDEHYQPVEQDHRSNIYQGPFGY